MSISLNANFELLSAGLYLDARQQFNTIIEMKDFAETSIPDGFITYNKETQKHYVFSSSNTVDATLGKWREYNSGNSSSTTYATWNSNVDYKVGNIVLKDEVRYSCIADHTSTDFETDSINWVVVLEQYYHVTQEQYNKMVSDGLITDGTKDLYIIDGNINGNDNENAGIEIYEDYSQFPMDFEFDCVVYAKNEYLDNGVTYNNGFYFANATTGTYTRLGGSSEKQIKDWVSGSSYLEGDYIYHEGELYRCLATNNNVDFDEINWEQLTYGIDELTKEDVERLLGLTKEEIEAMADLILDTEVRIDKTYSSSKIYTDIQQCLEDSKTYTDEQVATMNVDNAIVCDDKPTYDCVDTISYTKDGVLETTTEKDTWFYYVDVDGILKQTRFIDNEEVTIISGGTVDFGDYVSKSTDVVSDYTGAEVDTAKVPDLSALHAMETLIRTDINSKVSTDLTDLENRITTNETNITDLENRVTTNEADITELQEQIDNLDVPEDVDLTEINDKLTQLETKTASSILRFSYWNGGTTDTYLQIPAPITVNDQSLFISITSLQGGCIILLSGDSNSNYKLTKCIRLSHDNILSHDATDTDGWSEKLSKVYVDKSNGYTYVKLGANGSVSIMGLNEPPVSVTTLPTDVIEEVPIVDLTQKAYQGVEDVGVTTLTPLFPSVVKVASGGVAIYYVVKNGWCNVNFKFNITSSTTFSWTDIAWGLPIPANSIDTVLMSDGKATQPIPIKITSTGSVSSKVLSAISTTDWWTGNVSYPVA